MKPARNGTTSSFCTCFSFRLKRSLPCIPLPSHHVPVPHSPIIMWIILSVSNLCSNVTFLVRPSPLTLFRVTLLLPNSWQLAYFSVIPYHFSSSDVMHSFAYFVLYSLSPFTRMWAQKGGIIVCFVLLVSLQPRRVPGRPLIIFLNKLIYTVILFIFCLFITRF